jgi:hypothetical protein
MVLGRNSERSLNAMNSSMDHSSGMHGRRASLRGGNGPPRQASMSFMGFTASRANRYRQASAGGIRSTSKSGLNPDDGTIGTAHRSRAPYRRYRVGENVLICCSSHWATLVNRHGFPPGDGTNADEQSGPYSFVMATVLTVHFDEFAEYYTVKRADSGAEQRADTGSVGQHLI